MTHPAARIRKATLMARTWQLAGGDVETFATSRHDRDFMQQLVAATNQRTGHKWPGASVDTLDVIETMLELAGDSPVA